MQTMDNLYELYRWVVWKKHRLDIAALYSQFESEDWEFVRSAIDSWINEHSEDWCDYAAGEYREPTSGPSEDDARRRAVAGAL